LLGRLIESIEMLLFPPPLFQIGYDERRKASKEKHSVFGGRLAFITRDYMDRNL
jgi:hypothetical protein